MLVIVGERHQRQLGAVPFTDLDGHRDGSLEVSRCPGDARRHIWAGFCLAQRATLCPGEEDRCAGRPVITINLNDRAGYSFFDRQFDGGLRYWDDVDKRGGRHLVVGGERDHHSAGFILPTLPGGEHKLSLERPVFVYRDAAGLGAGVNLHRLGTSRSAGQRDQDLTARRPVGPRDRHGRTDRHLRGYDAQTRQRSRCWLLGWPRTRCLDSELGYCRYCKVGGIGHDDGFRLALPIFPGRQLDGRLEVTVHRRDSRQTGAAFASKR